MLDGWKKTFLALMAVILSSGPWGGCSKDRPGDDVVTDYNVLLVTLDTFRKSRLSCYGNTVQTSPCLDALAADGVKFEMAIVQAAVTPVSHASVLTGLNPYSHGVRVLHAASGYKLPEWVPTLTSVLHDAGWSTGAFLSSFAVSEHFGFDREFDVFDNGLGGGVENKMRQDKEGHWRWDVRNNQRRADETTDKAIRWIGKSRKPFFAWVHYWDPHDPLMVPPEAVTKRFVSPTASRAERPIQLYDAEIFYADSQFGHLLEKLKDAGQYDNTVIVVIADHGQGLNDGLKNHGWFAHRILYQEQINVPFIMRIPGGPRGRVVPELVRSIDIFPTVLEIVEVPAPGPVEGVSLCGLIDGRPEPPRAAYADALNLFDLNAAMVRQRPDADLLYCAMDQEWKLIYRPRRPQESELYNLKSDPKELNNLYKVHPGQARRLLAQLERLDCFVDKPFEVLNADEAERREALERLRALGYVGGFVEAETSGLPPQADGDDSP